MKGRSSAWFGVLLAAAATHAGAQEPAAPPSISDNSFLMEEAYNQEPGVVQHISAFQLFRGADSWAYSFTQEWPLFGRTHQLSYTLPIQRTHNGSAIATGLGDVAVNYRVQLAAAERLSVAPRLSLLLPTGRAKSDLGAGALGIQVNLPASVVVARKVVTHWNAGGTLTPSAKNAVGDKATAVATGLGDIAVNYRFQLAAAERLSVAPRLSLLLPTGRAKADLGAGALGVQVNLPASVVVARQVVTHWNAGGTVTPSAKNAVGDKATTVAYNLGASVVWLARPTFNALLEIVWTREEAVTGPGRTAASDGLSVSPGIRWAHNFSSGLQIVPGIAFPIGVGPSAGDDALLLYLSFEHPFRSGGH